MPDPVLYALIIAAGLALPYFLWNSLDEKLSQQGADHFLDPESHRITDTYRTPPQVLIAALVGLAELYISRAISQSHENLRSNRETEALEWTLFLLGVLTISFSAYLYKFFNEKRQHLRDGQASLIMDSVLEEEQKQYCLYLRPFYVTRRMRTNNPKFPTANPYSPSLLFRNRKVDLETVLSEAVEPYGPLVALGSPGEAIGAGRILSDEEVWQDYFKKLAKGANLILLVPSERPGTYWEIDWIMRQSLSAIFEASPPRSGSLSTSAPVRPVELADADRTVRGPPEDRHHRGHDLDDPAPAAVAAPGSLEEPAGCPTSDDRVH